MSVILHLLLAAAFIAVLIVLRILVTRQVLRQRMASRLTDDDCAEKECFGGCGGHKTTADRNRA